VYAYLLSLASHVSAMKKQPLIDHPLSTLSLDIEII